MRQHGFERPFHPLQVASWIVFAVDAAAFGGVGLPLFGDGDASCVAASFLFGASVACLTLAWIRTTRCDPSDPHLKGCKDAKLEAKGFEMHYCEDCKSSVYPRSKHCRACDKCVHVFDHHCIWLNNCIGQSNYGSFFLAVSSVAVTTATILLCSFSALHEYTLDFEAFEQRLRRVYGRAHPDFVFATLVALVAVNLPLCLADLQLLFFHIYLTTQHMTTFDYINNKRAVEEEEHQDGGEQFKEGGEECGQSQGAGDWRRKRRFLCRRGALPRCCDWIVYKSRRRRGKTTGHISFDQKVEPDVIGSQEISALVHARDPDPMGNVPAGPGEFAQTALPDKEAESPCCTPRTPPPDRDAAGVIV